MAELTFNVERLTQMETAALVKINGAIDAKTVVLFQEKLDQFQSEGYTRFILDMEGIKYVNSTGLGTLVNVADALENKGGGIALIKIHPKVKVVFDMLGLNAFFKIYSNEEEALSHFQKGDKKTDTKSAQASTAFQEVHTYSSSPSANNTQSTTPQQPNAASDADNNVLTTKANPPLKPGDPFSLVCAICKVKLNIPKPGSYKCPRCSTFFKLYEDGRVSFSERKKASPLQMKLSCTDECMHGLAEFVGVLAQRIGFSSEDVIILKESILEVCSAIMEKAYDNKQYLSYNVVINPSSVDLKIQISDYGKYIYEQCFPKTSQNMDEFEHKQHPKGGNIINFGKIIR